MADIPKSTDPSDARPLPIIGIGASAGGIPALKTFTYGTSGQAREQRSSSCSSRSRSCERDGQHSCARLSAMRVVQSIGPAHARGRYSLCHRPPTANLRSRVTISSVRRSRTPRKAYPDRHFFPLTSEETHDGFAVVMLAAASTARLACACQGTGGLVLVRIPGKRRVSVDARSRIASGADYVLPLRQLACGSPSLCKIKRGSTSAPSTARARKCCGEFWIMSGSRRGKISQSTTRNHNRRLGSPYAARANAEPNRYLPSQRKSERSPGAAQRSLDLSESFFSGPAVFEALAKKIIPTLFDRKNHGTPLRVWVPGCAQVRRPTLLRFFFSKKRRPARQHARYSDLCQ